MIIYLVMVVYNKYAPTLYTSTDFQYAEDMYNALYGKRFLYKISPDESGIPELLKGREE